MVEPGMVPVKAAGGFIEEQQTGASENLQGNAEATLFTSTETPQPKVAHESVLTGSEPHLQDGAAHDCLLLFATRLVWQSQSGRVHDALPHCQSADQHILLRHICLSCFVKTIMLTTPDLKNGSR